MQANLRHAQYVQVDLNLRVKIVIKKIAISKSNADTPNDDDNDTHALNLNQGWWRNIADKELIPLEDRIFCDFEICNFSQFN